ncbi:ankyrin repeat protein [Elysia marginata]|uniref:Ankyrin repeat protein n=1 Tax=Elysia marginata TaxID=1093978 RepID=A0AAV4HC08_9GAST|nr:ankyrin repeat protein [Elysia marginata]
MSFLDSVNWKSISFQELDSLLRLQGDVDKVVVDEDQYYSRTPLCNACKNNREDLVTILLHHGAAIEKRSPFYGKQPLHFACDHSCGNLGMVRKILDAKANVDAQDMDGNTALHLACNESNVPVAELLLERNANVNLINIDGETPLVWACRARSHRLVEALLKAKSDPNVGDGLPLEIAVDTGSVETLRLLIASGADIQRRAYLAQASECNQLDMMKVLNNCGADLNKTNSLGKTPLQAACSSEQTSTEAVRLLLSWGANVNVCSSTHMSAMHYACDRLYLDKVRLLLAYGADPGLKWAHQMTPIEQAWIGFLLGRHESQDIDCSIVQIMKLLLAAGARLRPGFRHLRSAIVLTPGLGPQAIQELLDLLGCQTSGPSKLQDLCRICIRNATNPNIDVNVTTMPLPKPIVSYLQFNDIFH